MLKDDMLNVFNFQQHLLFIDGGNDRCNSGTQISALAWQTVHKHIAA